MPKEKEWCFLVEYTHFLSDEGESIPKLGGDTDGKDCWFHVAFKVLDDEVDWVDGNWICPQEKYKFNYIDEVAVYRMSTNTRRKTTLYWTSLGMKY
ncbi:hypothetical protein K7X08_021833 [Anisodus acutangulus]|uniref:Uncharacterized protein n=1 Tax=Anisodus acutangulus TaxID=402998 RepID=A0A9Q1L3N6_9SOLA|nr:hypothetical protein K7X08_021833 [Anisodus acutangulus]